MPSAARTYDAYRRLRANARLREVDPWANPQQQADALNDQYNAEAFRRGLAPMILDDVERALVGLDMIVPNSGTVAQL